eukprot:5096115-Prymnesium_polylepis.3
MGEIGRPARPHGFSAAGTPRERPERPSAARSGSMSSSAAGLTRPSVPPLEEGPTAMGAGGSTWTGAGVTGSSAVAGAAAGAGAGATGEGAGAGAVAAGAAAGTGVATAAAAAVGGQKGAAAEDLDSAAEVAELIAVARRTMLRLAREPRASPERRRPCFAGLFVKLYERSSGPPLFTVRQFPKCGN